MLNADFVLSLVVFALIFLALFYCYYNAQVRIKHDECVLSACERSLLPSYQQQARHHLFFGGQEITTISGHADLSSEFEKKPPSYDQVIADNPPPPPYSEAIQYLPHTCSRSSINRTANDSQLSEIVIIPCSSEAISRA